MTPQNGRRGNSNSEADSFEGRDLLVGRPEGGGDKPSGGGAKSPQPNTHDHAIAVILETVRATASRIDALQDAAGPEYDTVEALARETAALTQAVADARGALAKAAELAARRDRAAEAAQALAGAAAALKTQGEALDRSLRATGGLAEATARQAKENGWQSEVTAQGIAEMNRTASLLQSSLRVHVENMTRFDNSQRLRFWLTALAMAAASFGFFTLGALL